MLRLGLDEAALGPILGPFCVCLTTFSIPAHVPQTDAPELYDLLADSISQTKNIPGRIAVADSKVLYSQSTGIKTLDAGVTAFLVAAGFSLPCSLTDLLSALSPQSDIKALKSTPWLAGAEDFSIPWNADAKDSQTNLKAALDKLGISFHLPSLRFVPAGAFNREITAHSGKGGGIRSIITPLLKEALGNSDERRITVDRQGGRRYYGEWLNDILPGAPLRALEEGPKRSAYTAGNRHIEFLVGADGIRMETALASMFAKYIRESAMKLFNSWWVKRVPGIRPTAGYPQDAKRFIADIKAAGAMPDNPDTLIRRL